MAAVAAPNRKSGDKNVRPIANLPSRPSSEPCPFRQVGQQQLVIRRLRIDLEPFAAVIMAYLDDYEALDEGYARERRRLREQLLELLGKYHPMFPRWIIPSLGIHFDRRLFQYLRRRGLRGPL